MKNLLKLTFLTAALTVSSAIFAQEVKKDAAAPAQTPAKTAAKTTTAPAKDAKAAQTPAGGSRMAINEQGVPSKTTTKAKAAAAPAVVDPAKKKDDK